MSDLDVPRVKRPVANLIKEMLVLTVSLNTFEKEDKRDATEAAYAKLLQLPFAPYWADLLQDRLKGGYQTLGGAIFPQLSFDAAAKYDGEALIGTIAEILGSVFYDGVLAASFDTGPAVDQSAEVAKQSLSSTLSGIKAAWEEGGAPDAPKVISGSWIAWAEKLVAENPRLAAEIDREILSRTGHHLAPNAGKTVAEILARHFPQIVLSELRASEVLSRGDAPKVAPTPLDLADPAVTVRAHIVALAADPEPVSALAASPETISQIAYRLFQTHQSELTRASSAEALGIISAACTTVSSEDGSSSGEIALELIQSTLRLWRGRTVNPELEAKDRNALLTGAINARLVSSQASLRQLASHLDWQDRASFEAASYEIITAALKEGKISESTFSVILNSGARQIVLDAYLTTAEENKVFWNVIFDTLFTDGYETSIDVRRMRELFDLADSSSLLLPLSKMNSEWAKNLFMEWMLERNDVSSWFNLETALAMAQARSRNPRSEEIPRVDLCLILAVNKYLSAPNAWQFCRHDHVHKRVVDAIMATHLQMKKVRKILLPQLQQ